MSLKNMLIGIGIMIICLFLAQSLPTYLTGLATSTMDLLKLGLLFIGIIAIFVGAVSE